jgi:CheY-like chemotaxis protein
MKNYIIFHKTTTYSQIRLLLDFWVNVFVQKKQRMKRFENILIIDDDPVSNYMTKEFLKRTDRIENISVCRNGRQGLRFLEQNQLNVPDLILLDIQMPIMNGFEFWETLKERNFDFNRTKIIFYSIYSDNLEAELKKYNTEIIKKPLTIEKFYEAVEKIYSLQRLAC